MTMSISSAPAATASAVSASLTCLLARPEGNAVATLATRTPLPASSWAAMGHHVGIDADRRDPRAGQVARVGRRGLGAQRAHLARVSAPSRVVRSIIEMARSIAQALAVVLIERVDRSATRASAPTPGRRPAGRAGTGAGAGRVRRCRDLGPTTGIPGSGRVTTGGLRLSAPVKAPQGRPGQVGQAGGGGDVSLTVGERQRRRTPSVGGAVALGYRRGHRTTSRGST